MINWYIIHTFSGFEQKVAETLRDVIKKKLFSDKIDDVLVPMHEVTEIRRGKRAHIIRRREVHCLVCSLLGA